MGVLVLCLVLGGVAIPADDLLQPPGHGLHQGPQVRAVAYPLGPQLLDVVLQLRNGGGLAVLQLGLHPSPSVFNGVEVRAVAWPVNQLDGRPLTTL